MPEFVRVKDRETKHEYSIVASTYDANLHELLKKEAVHTDGTALPPKHHVNLNKQGEPGGTQYASMSKSALQAEIEARNEERAEADFIVIGGRATKADMVSALEAADALSDDAEANHESLSSNTDEGNPADVPSGQQAESDKETH